MKTAGGSRPDWCQPMTWVAYAERRYDRGKARLSNLLRESAYARSESGVPNGWTTEGSNIVVWEERDVFGRKPFQWDDIPSSLIDEERSVGGRTVLHQTTTEEFIGRSLHRSSLRWKLWR